LEEKLLEVGWSREMISRAFEKAGIEESSYEMEIVPYRPEPESETEPDLSSQARVELESPPPAHSPSKKPLREREAFTFPEERSIWSDRSADYAPGIRNELEDFVVRMSWRLGRAISRGARKLWRWIRNR